MLAFSNISVQATNYVAMSLDQIGRIHVASDNIATTSFTAAVDGFYNFETFPLEVYCDTYLRLVDSSGTTYSDDDSGERNFSCIGKKMKAGEKVTILVALIGDNQSFDVALQVRRQKAKLFAFDYSVMGDPLNTYNQLLTPSARINALGYFTTEFHNGGAGLKQQDKELFYQIGSEVYGYFGHGNAGYVAYIETDPDGTKHGYIMDQTNIQDMGNTKLAYWSGCLTAAASSSSHSMAQLSIDKGAQCAIGWNQSIYNTSAKKFNDAFFTNINAGYTVAKAAELAKGTISNQNDTVRDYQVLGDKNTLLMSAAIHPRNDFILRPTSLKNLDKEQLETTTKKSRFEYQSDAKTIRDFQAQLEKYDYSTTELGYLEENHWVRYYRMINGMRVMDDFYDVTIKPDGSILNVSKSKDTIMETELSQAKVVAGQASVMQLSAPRVLSSENPSDSIVDSKNYMQLIKKDGQIIPVQFIETTYHHEEPEIERFEYNYLEITCMNLLDGSFIDYDSIISVEYADEL